LTTENSCFLFQRDLRNDEEYLFLEHQLSLFGNLAFVSTPVVVSTQAFVAFVKNVSTTISTYKTKRF